MFNNYLCVIMRRDQLRVDKMENVSLVIEVCKREVLSFQLVIGKFKDKVEVQGRSGFFFIRIMWLLVKQVWVLVKLVVIQFGCRVDLFFIYFQVVFRDFRWGCQLFWIVMIKYYRWVV